MAQTKRSATTPKSAAKKPAKVVTVPIGDKLLLTVEEFAALVGISRKTGYELVMRKRVRSLMIGRLRRIPRQAVEAFVASLPDAA